MSYSVRNTIILLTVILFIIGIGYLLTQSYFKRKLRQTAETIQQTQQKTIILPELNENLKVLEKQIENNRIKLSQLDKAVDSTATPSSVYSYIDSIQDRFGSFKCVITFNGDSVLSQYSYHDFLIKGEGSFSTINSLIRALEQGPKLFRINKLSMHSAESYDQEIKKTVVLIVFDMELWALYARLKDLPAIKKTLSDVRIPNIKINPFRPYIYNNLPPNEDGLPEVERSQLKAIILNKAIILDHTGKTRTLKAGDRVYLGYVENINSAKEQVEFILDKGGIVERYILKLSVARKE